MSDGDSNTPLDYTTPAQGPPKPLLIAARLFSCFGCLWSFGMWLALGMVTRGQFGGELVFTCIPELLGFLFSLWLRQLHRDAGLPLTAPRVYLIASLLSLIAWGIFLASFPRYVV